MSETSGEVVRSGNAKFIVIEGIDGSGSTTQGQDLANAFRKRRPTVFTREPSTGPIGMLIRLALTGRLKGYVENGFHDAEPDDEEMATELDPQAMALLFAADRRDHIAAEIEPNLRKGRTVISDRYLLSTLAYQGLTLDLDWLIAINAKAIVPDLTIFLDVEVEKARTRIQGTRWTEDIYESVFQQRRVREKYHDIIDRHFPIVGPVLRVDAGRPKEVVFNHISQILTQFFDTGVIADEPPAELELFR